MKKTMYQGFVLAVALVFFGSAGMAAECSGPWRVLPNYSPGHGGVCAAIGLNTHQAVCQPGQRYATYCDDASGGRYRVCQSNIVCHQGQRGGYGHDYDNRRNDQRDYRNDWHDNNQYWRDDYRDDRRDERWDDYHNYNRKQQRDCTQWDYQSNRPCAPGTINRDCRNGCDGRVY